MPQENPNDRPDFTEQIEASVARYEAVRGELDHVLGAMKGKIRGLFKSSEVQPLFITGRVKSTESFRSKASRQLQQDADSSPVLEFPNPLRELHDMVGLRIIVMLPHEIQQVASIIKSHREAFDCRSDREKDIGSVESGTYGYSSRHLLLKTRNEPTVRKFQEALGKPVVASGNFIFEVQVRTILQHAWSEMEHDIRFKHPGTSVWNPQIDRLFTATAAMLETVEDYFTDIDELYHRLNGYQDRHSLGAQELSGALIGEVWQTLLPHVDRKRDDDWSWAAELLGAHGINRVWQFVQLLDPSGVTEVRAALDHRYSPGPDRLLDDLLLWHFGSAHIEKTSGSDLRRQGSLTRRLIQMSDYRMSKQNPQSGS
ncbi:(p)ppGpp synthetase [Glutamicibacter sp. PS]|uniref:GTP pyrophosphokinase n=1 Tax=Glutamicibacter sp. PS TaxID=3075634 RepID=UPI00284E06A9|nr:(p)ppGpp synthetase [Glutamicibacter sp. PS]MDR4532866.1 (p)ppGpp synthetase [Glutamicibacter sp. PS]